MAKLNFILDPIANTLNIWWGEPQTNDYSEESDKTNDVIIYSKTGTPKGVEIIGLFPPELNITKQLGKDKIQKYLNFPENFISELRDKPI